MFTNRRTRYEDLLFVALLLLPAVVGASRYLQSESQMNQIALQSRLPATILAQAPAATQLVATSASIVHRF